MGLEFTRIRACPSVEYISGLMSSRCSHRWHLCRISGYNLSSRGSDVNQWEETYFRQNAPIDMSPQRGCHRESVFT